MPASLAIQQPAAPSVIGDEFPAVSVPSPLVLSKAGLSETSFSAEVSARGLASRSSSGNLMTRSSKNPLFQPATARWWLRSEEHKSELQSLMRISYAVFCLTK